MIYLRNTHPTKRTLVPTGRGWARLLYPGVTSGVPSAALALPGVQRQLDDGRLAVVTECTAARLRRDMQAAILAAERAELAALLARQQRQQQHMPAAAVLGGRAPRDPADDDRLRREWCAGTPRAVIGQMLGLTPQGAGNRAKAVRLPARPRNFRSPSA